MSDFAFQFYDPDKPTTLRRRCLPHLEQRNICYFVTMMAGDAFPKAAQEKWDQHKQIWCRQHGFPNMATRKEIFEQLTGHQRKKFVRTMSSAYQKCLDKGSGACLLMNPEAAQIVEEAFLYHQGQTCHIADRVVMPNHVHFLIQPDPELTLKEILKSIRQFTATRINRLNNRSGRYWSHETFRSHGTLPTIL